MNAQRPAISGIEFVAIMAVMTATAALSIDGMLPALPDIGAALSPDAPNKAQFVLSFFIWGLALGTFVAGPISDAMGRKITSYLGLALFCLGSILSYLSTNIELMFAARFLQGIGAAAPRIVAQAIIRDFYSGREMARFTSLVMMIFALVPSFAPLLGSFVIAGFGWRAVFAGFFLFGLLTLIWLALRIPESLPKDRRMEFSLSRLINALRDVFKVKTVRISIVGLVACYSILFVTLILVQPIFEHVFDRGDTFVFWFAAASIFVGVSSIFNSSLVIRFGMRALTFYAVMMLVATTAIVLINALIHPAGDGFDFALFYLWLMSIFVMIGFSIGNLTALAMEPLGHIAGTAASTVNAIATFGSVIFATMIGQQFDKTALPMMVGVFGATLVALICVLELRKLERAPA